MRKLRRLLKKETGTWLLAGVTMVVAGLSLWSANRLYNTRNEQLSKPEATGNCTLTYTLAATPTTSSSCPAGTTLLFANAGPLSVGSQVSLGGTVSLLTGTWTVGSTGGAGNNNGGLLMANGGSRITVNFPNNVVLYSVWIFDNDPKPANGEVPWTINGVSLPVTGDNQWGPLFNFNRTANQMVFYAGGDSPHFNLCVKSVSGTATPTPSLSNFEAKVDTFVRSDNPTVNYGSTANLRADGSPTMVTYMKFDLTALANRTITRANLRLYANNATTGSLNVKSSTTDWGETTMTFNNRPAPGSLVRTFTAPAVGWVTVDLTSFVNANKGRVVSVAIDTASGDDLVVNSRNATSNKPYIQVQ